MNALNLNFHRPKRCTLSFTVENNRPHLIVSDLTMADIKAVAYGYRVTPVEKAAGGAFIKRKYYTLTTAPAPAGAIAIAEPLVYLQPTDQTTMVTVAGLTMAELVTLASGARLIRFKETEAGFCSACIEGYAFSVQTELFPEAEAPTVRSLILKNNNYKPLRRKTALQTQ